MVSDPTAPNQVPQTVSNNNLHPFPSDPPLHGDRRWIALVTGAARGIGLAIALRLAKDGFDVAVNDIDGAEVESAVKAIQPIGVRSVGVVGDVSNEESVEKMIEETVATLGYLDVMVANAGIVVTKPFLDMTVPDVDRLFDVNVRGVFLCYKHAAKHFIKQQTGGKLVATSSLSGFMPHWAIRGLNESAALELAPHGITANAIAPGAVETRMRQQVGEDLCIYTKLAVDEAWQKTIALGRTGVPDDVANVVSFLASRNSNYMTGQTLIVDGGICMT